MELIFFPSINICEIYDLNPEGNKSIVAPLFA